MKTGWTIRMAAAVVLLCVATGDLLAQNQGNTTYTFSFVLVNGTTIKIAIDGTPQKAINSGTVVNNLMNSQAWILALEDRTLIIPVANVLYVECTPVMPVSPTVNNNVVKGRLIQGPGK